MPKPDLDAFIVPIEDIKPWSRNPRKNDKAAKRLAEVIADFGFVDAIILQRGTNRILAGHTRLKAAKAEGYTEVPVRYADMNDEAHAAKFTVVHNRTSEFAQWDMEEVASIADDFDFSMATDFQFDNFEEPVFDTEDLEDFEEPEGFAEPIPERSSLTYLEHLVTAGDPEFRDDSYAVRIQCDEFELEDFEEMAHLIKSFGVKAHFHFKDPFVLRAVATLV